MNSLNITQKRLFIAQTTLNIFILLLLVTTSIITFCILKKISQTEITIVSLLFDLGDVFRASSIWDKLVFFISSAFIIYGALRASMLFYPIFICFGMCTFYTYISLRIIYIFTFPSGCINDTRIIKVCYSSWGLFLFSIIAILCIILKICLKRHRTQKGADSFKKL